MNPTYSNQSKFRISRCYGTSRPIKRESCNTSRPSQRDLTVYSTSRSRGVNKNAIVLLGQSRDRPSMAPDHAELTQIRK